jgi:hypothetical protein
VGRAYISECIEDGIAGRTSCDLLHALHLDQGGSACIDDVYEASDDCYEGSLTNDEQRAIDNSDALSWALKRLALLSERLDVGNNFGGRGQRKDRSGQGQSRGDDSAERDHGCGFWEWRKDLFVDGVCVWRR